MHSSDGTYPDTEICCMQMLEAGALKPLAEHLNGQQLTWLQALVAGKAPEARAAEAAALACFLAGCSPQGFRYPPAFYGCLAAHMLVALWVPKDSAHCKATSRVWGAACRTSHLELKHGLSTAEICWIGRRLCAGWGP